VNLLLLAPGEVAPDGSVELTDRRAEHLRRVLRVTPGKEVRLGVRRGPLGRGRVTEVSAERVRLVAELEAAAPPPPRVDLVLAMPRPKALSRVLETAASLGVRRIDLINAWRVERSYFESPRLEPAAIDEHLGLGCEQGGATWVPEVVVHRLFVPFMSELAERLAVMSTASNTVAPRGLVAHPRVTRELEAVFAPGTGDPVVLAIGPEGGFIERELDSFARVGFASFSLGPAVMRVEVAVVAALAQLSLLRRLGN
jgi:RsmE family RNA methyltransferase